MPVETLVVGREGSGSVAGVDVSPLVAVLAFAMACVVAYWFLIDRLRLAVDLAEHHPDSLREALTTSPALAAWPLALLPLAFALSFAVNLVWLLIVVALVGGLALLAATILRRVHRDDGAIPGPTVATMLALLVALEFHWLLVVRLSVVPDPKAPVNAAFAGSALQAGGFGILLPAVGIALVLLAVTQVVRLRRWTAWIPPLSGWRGLAVTVVALVALFGLPAVPGIGEDAQLTALGIATPEYGKILYFWVLAVVVARYVVNAEPAAKGWRRGLDPRLWVPALLFAIAAGASAFRNDLGPIIPIFVGTLGMAWVALRDEAVHRGRAASRTAWQVFWRDQSLPLGVLVVIFIGIAFTTDYVQARLEVAGNGWQYVWNYDCEPVDELPAELRNPETSYGATVCLRRQLPAESSNRAQVSKAGAAIADGGAFGRGLSDTVSQKVPLQSTDFVIAAVWSKLGGLVVFGFGALLVLLALGLGRAVWWQRRRGDGYSTLPPPADRSRLFAAGLAASILGQHAFVLAATLNWIPHSGITAPLLSRGGQSTLALAAGVVIALAVAYHDHRPPDARVVDPASTPPRAPTKVGPFAIGGVALVALLLATMFPYGRHGTDRPLCSGKAPVVDPEVCSTDLIAYGRTLREVTLPDGSRFVSHAGGAWQRVDGTGPGPEGLGGILTAAGVPGLAEQVLPGAFGGAAPSTFGDRVLPHVFGDSPDAFAELTVDPRLQVAATKALTAESSDPATPVLAGGIVVLDAQSGHVLAAASAPATLPATSERVELTDEQLTAFNERYGGYGTQQQPDGRIAEDPIACKLRPAIEDNRNDCARWFLRPERFVDYKALQADENERYIADGSSAPVAEKVPRPDERVNRAFAESYQYGSTFKVVVAAAWLHEDPSRTAMDMIPAPVTYPLPGREVGNLGGGKCPGTENGQMSLQTALAVSCNTAFVALADELGWEKIKPIAQAFGFAVGDVTDPYYVRPKDALAGSPFALRSLVPPQASGLAVANVALGGNQLQGTPLQMASVMATIANRGRYVQPTLASKVRMLGVDEAVAVQGLPVEVLSPGVAEQLRVALVRTADPMCDSCTAHRLRRPEGVTVFAKTGTHVREAGGSSYVDEFAWIAGFIEQPKAPPVAFAIVLEAPDRRGVGGARAREVVAKVLDAVVGVR
jgi:cell division protein FtsI/penicillin-binding protein 2/cell division protein FtsW (lipid II flippase)